MLTVLALIGFFTIEGLGIFGLGWLADYVEQNFGPNRKAKAAAASICVVGGAALTGLLILIAANVPVIP